MKKLYIIITLVAVLLTSCNSYNSTYNPTPLSDADSKEYKLDPDFYKKTTKVQNILIASSGNVSDATHRETAYLFDKMMKNVRPDIAQRVRDQAVLCILVAWNELTSDVPQFATKKTGKDLDLYNWRSRGFLSKKHNRFVVLFAEEDVLEYEGGMQRESILVHEFGHVIHKAGFDEALENRLTDTFNKSMEDKIWQDGRAAQRFRRVKSSTPVSLLAALKKSFPYIQEKQLAQYIDQGDILVNGSRSSADVKVTKDDKVLIVFGGPKACYATRNKAEYFAEGFQIWFNTNRTMDHDHNHIQTREQLLEYDPHLSAFCKDVLADCDWRFVSPRKRAGKGHLYDFSTEKSPVKTNPEHITNAANDYYDRYWKDYWQRLVEKHSLNE